ncbi:MAG: pimeloyl-CoA dehydrogenase small subunit [Rhodospirillaceae bacterium]|nr:MAG: pimeloyl-CoA dehydrogenase small subunit [Rhodospirillaceae bacterium]
MDFDLNEDQRALKDGVERLLGDRYDFEQRKKHMAESDGWSREQWGRYAEMGLLALPFAESDGGIGGGAVETLIVMEAFGSALVLEPYLATVVLGGGFLRLAGSAAQRADLIPRISDGSLLLAFAQAEQQSRYDLADVATAARRDGAGWVINGRKRYVLHGDCADKIIVTARISGGSCDRTGIGLFIVDAAAAGVSRRGYPTQDRLRSAEITFENVRVDADAVIGEPGAALPLIEQVVSAAMAALCAEAVGAMTRAHTVTVDYLKMRKQFGTTIGSFQALQHRAVDMLVQVELARSMALYAAMMSEEPNALKRGSAVSAAKAQIGRAGHFVGGQAVQLHGGIGMTNEYMIGHYYRRLTMIDLQFGDSNHHLGVLARTGGLLESAEI